MKVKRFFELYAITVLMSFIGIFIEVFIHEGLHAALSVILKRDFVGIQLASWPPGLIYISHTDSMVENFIVAMGPLLINVCMGLLLLVLCVRNHFGKWQRFLVIVSGVFVSMICFQSYNLYYMIGDISSWTITIESFLFVRGFYKFLPFLCVPFIYISIKGYFYLIHPQVVYYTASMRSLVIEILLPAITVLLILGCFANISNGASTDMEVIFRESKFLRNTLPLNEGKPTVISIDGNEDMNSLSRVLIENDIVTEKIVFLMGSTYEVTGYCKLFERSSGYLYIAERMVKVEFIHEKGSFGSLSRRLVAIVPDIKLTPESPTSMFPCLLMLIFYCAVAVGSVVLITYLNRTRLGVS